MRVRTHEATLPLAGRRCYGCRRGAAGYYHFHDSRAAGEWRTMPIRHGEIQVIVNSTGTVQPVLSVQVGASFPARSIRSTWTSTTKVKANQVLAKIDPRTYQAALAHEEAASLAHAQADLERVSPPGASGPQRAALGPVADAEGGRRERRGTDRHRSEVARSPGPSRPGSVRECEANLPPPRRTSISRKSAHPWTES